MKKLCLGLLLAVWLGLFPATAWAADVPNNYLTVEQQLEIVDKVKFLGVNMDLGIPAYNPAELQVGLPVPLYAYTDAGFVEVGQELPLLFEGEPLFFVNVHEDGYSLNLPFARWWQEVGVPSDKPIALVMDYNGYYVYDGTVWWLLHETVDSHLKQEDYAQLDTQNVDAKDLPLTELRAVLSLKDAYLGHFPGEHDVSIYLNGEKQSAHGLVKKGRTLLPLRDICNIFGVQVEYADATQIITLHNRQDVYTLRLNERGVQCNGRHFATLDVPALERDGRTYLPLRSLARILQIEVAWNEPELRVDLQTNP